MGKEILRSGSIPAGNIQDSEQESGCEKLPMNFPCELFTISYLPTLNL